MPSTRNERDPSRLVLRFLQRHGIPEGARILVGFSGGPDSRALLELLLELRPRLALSLQAAYLDHGIRPEAERRDELEFVQRACRLLGVPLASEALQPGLLRERAREEGRSLEELARECRHRFLLRTAERLGCAYIALAHTADDQTETLIMRFFQGSGTGGLAGIPACRGRIIRPVLGCGRAELRRFLASRGIEFRIDSSNLNPEHLRNAVRLKLVPILEELFPGFRAGLTSFAGSMARLNALLEGEASQRLAWREVPGGFSIPAQRFREAPAVLRVLSLYPLLAALGARGGRRDASKRIPLRFLSPIRDEEQLAKRRVLLAGYGVRLYRRGSCFYLEKDIVGTYKKGYLIAVEPHCRCAVLGAGLAFRFMSNPRGEQGVAVDADRGQGTVLVRSGTAGDYIRTPRGTRAVSKLCSEWQLPSTERWKVPIVADRSGVLAVLGRALGGKNRTRSDLPRNEPETMAVEVEAGRVEEE